MVVSIIYILVFLIISFLSYLIIMSLIRGIDGKNKNKK